ncbi:hypothetical protein JTB14_034295 [Gonioctena quinquepunctata]|nr:hypothetical protein JTB14_034295 [Gonioctena quinquepunctata]
MSGKVLFGGKSTFEKYSRGLGEFFFDQSEKYGNKIYQIDAETGKEETFHSIRTRSIRVAISLRKLGITSDDNIINCLNNTMDCSIPHLSSVYLGAKVAALYPALSSKEWYHILNMFRPRLIFVEADDVKKMEDCLKELGENPEIVVAGRSEKYRTLDDLQKPDAEETTFRPKVVEDCQETAIVVFSSGTTDLPKGMCLSHFSAINATMNVSKMDINDPTMVLSYSPLNWIASILMMTRCFLRGGCKLIPPSKYDPDEILKMIEKYKVTHIMTIPKIFLDIVNSKADKNVETSSIYHVLMTGTGTGPENVLKIRELFNKSYVTLGYGCTEACGGITCFDLTRDRHLLHKVGSAGRCVKDMEVKVVDVESRDLLGPHQKGEICFRSPYALKQYYNVDASSNFDEDGFFKSGDVGYYDEDECLYIVDRIKELFKYKGYPVVPGYLERILMEHPSVKEAGVFGIPHEDDGHRTAACVDS